MKLRSTLLTAATLVVATMVSIAAEGAQNVIMWQNKSVPAQVGGTVKITSDRGDVKIRSWNQNKVVVRSEAVHSTIVVNAETKDGQVNIEAHGYNAGSNVGQIIHVIYVPANSVVEVGTVGGSVTLDDPNNTLTITKVVAAETNTDSIQPATF